MGEHSIDTYEHHEKPTARRSRPSLSNPRSTNDIVWGLLACEPNNLTVRHESCPHNWRRLWEGLCVGIGGGSRELRRYF